MHILWECPDVQRFWRNVVEKVSMLVGRQLPLSPALLLLNDDSNCKMSERGRKLWLASMTAAKKLIVLRWLPPHQLSTRRWLQNLLEVVFLELSSARINGARTQTLEMWSTAAERTKAFLGL